MGVLADVVGRCGWYGDHDKVLEAMLLWMLLFLEIGKIQKFHEKVFFGCSPLILVEILSLYFWFLGLTLGEGMKLSLQRSLYCLTRAE